MTKTEKLRKLGNAIREYRGAFNPASGKWIRSPKPNKVERILYWLELLGVQEPIVSLADIQEFKTFSEMRKWLANI